jgi:dTDP-4-dehydrorhamnose 3,5-epimerase
MKILDSSDGSIIDGVFFTPMKIIENPSGDLYHVVRKSSSGFVGFGEAYISTIQKGKVKGWKKHHKMTMNIVVPSGEVCIVIYDDRPESATCHAFFEITLSLDNYVRLTIPPNLWAAFLGIGAKSNIILNVADCEHDESKSEAVEFQAIPYIWGSNVRSGR